MRTGEDEKIRNSWNLFFFLSWQRGNATAKGKGRPLINGKENSVWDFRPEGF